MHGEKMVISNLIEITTETERSDILRRRTRPIGILLAEAGKMSNEDIDSIRRLQTMDKKLLFGEAAIKLGLVKQQDVDRALSRQFDVNYLIMGDSRISHEVFAAYYPSAPETESLRRLRTTLLMKHFDGSGESRILAIASAHRREGRSVLAANLAVMFANIGKRTLLIDADLRNPRQHVLFGFRNRRGLSHILASHDSTDIIEHVGDLKDLFVLPAGVIPPSPQELVGRAVFSLLLVELSKQFDIVLIDTPAMEEYSDAQVISATAGSALLVARDNVSQVAALQAMTNNFNQSGVNLLGAVINKF